MKMYPFKLGEQDMPIPLVPIVAFGAGTVLGAVGSEAKLFIKAKNRERKQIRKFLKEYEANKEVMDILTPDKDTPF